MYTKNSKICKIKLCNLDLLTIILTCNLSSYRLDCLKKHANHLNDPSCNYLSINLNQLRYS